MKPIIRNPSSNKVLVAPTAGKAINLNQGVLDLQIQKQIEIDGVGMGVLTDGMPFLTGRGLARLSGVNNVRVLELSADWDKGAPTTTAQQSAP